MALQMWADDASPFEGRHYRVAEYGDACNLFDIADGGETIRHKLDVLSRHCEAVGRPFERGCAAGVTPSPQATRSTFSDERGPSRRSSTASSTGPWIAVASRSSAISTSTGPIV
jgi:hypothetical protein